MANTKGRTGSGSTWRWTTGQKGVNRITVFERPDATSIYVEWWDDEGRHKRALSNALGQPITDRELAKKLAVRMAQAQERRRNQQAAELAGLPRRRTLTELLDRLHEDRGSTWSKSYSRDQERYKRWWLEKLGDIELRSITPAVVERTVRRASDERDWSPRTEGAYLRYLIDALYYAQRKLKWITERDNLSAVTMPKPKSQSRAYSLEEARKLLPALGDIDWRAEWIARVALQTGRRLTAIRTLPEEGRIKMLDHQTAALFFPAHTDKADTESEAIVYGKAAVLSARAGTDDYEVPSIDECQYWLQRAEEAAGVEHVDYRAWHGFKRLWATITKGHPAREKQGATTRQTLDSRYEQDWREMKADLAEKAASMLGV